MSTIASAKILNDTQAYMLCIFSEWCDDDEDD